MGPQGASARTAHPVVARVKLEAPDRDDAAPGRTLGPGWDHGLDAARLQRGEDAGHGIAGSPTDLVRPSHQSSGGLLRVPNTQSQWSGLTRRIPWSGMGVIHSDR